MSDDELFDKGILAYVGLDVDDEVVEYYISSKADNARARKIIDNNFEEEDLGEALEADQKYPVKSPIAEDISNREKILKAFPKLSLDASTPKEDPILITDEDIKNYQDWAAKMPKDINLDNPKDRKTFQDWINKAPKNGNLIVAEIKKRE